MGGSGGSGVSEWDDTEPWAREPEELGGEFEFEAGVKVEARWYDADGVPQLATTYTVRLPHQCDAWEITEERDRDAAIEVMETFIREAQAALEKLREAT